jgi:hypothetical protein
MDFVTLGQRRPLSWNSIDPRICPDYYKHSSFPISFILDPIPDPQSRLLLFRLCKFQSCRPFPFPLKFEGSPAIASARLFRIITVVCRQYL